MRTVWRKNGRYPTWTYSRLNAAIGGASGALFSARSATSFNATPPRSTQRSTSPTVSAPAIAALACFSICARRIAGNAMRKPDQQRHHDQRDEVSASPHRHRA